MYISEIQKEIQQKFSVSKIIAFELVTFSFDEREYLSLWANMLTNSLNNSGTTKTEFFNWRSFRVTKKYDKNTAVDISALFWDF